MRAISKKRAKVQRKRKKLIAKRIGAPCEIRWEGYCMGTGVTLHEPLLRSRGGDPASEEGTVWTCSSCHMAVHQFPEEAARRGWMIHSWEGLRA